MDKNYLIKTASLIKDVSPETAEEYIQKAEQLTYRINSLMLARTDIDNLVGKNNIDMMKDNHSNHVRFIGSILRNNNPHVLVHTVLWVFRVYINHGFAPNYWASQLNAWFFILEEILTEKSYSEVYPFYEWMQVNIPIFVKVCKEEIDS
ncbi:MAG: hypothetical protein ACFCUM_07065 [Bacteroidales bacterium]